MSKCSWKWHFSRQSNRNSRTKVNHWINEKRFKRYLNQSMIEVHSPLPLLLESPRSSTAYGGWLSKTSLMLLSLSEPSIGSGEGRLISFLCFSSSSSSSSESKTSTWEDFFLFFLSCTELVDLSVSKLETIGVCIHNIIWIQHALDNVCEHIWHIQMQTEA